MGVVVVVAAGNENEPACKTNYGYHPDCFTVGSTRALFDMPSGFSNYGPCVDVSLLLLPRCVAADRGSDCLTPLCRLSSSQVWAPGSGIYSAIPSSDNNFYGTMQGTSMAAPAVAGLVAHVMSRKDDWAPTRESAEAIKR